MPPPNQPQERGMRQEERGGGCRSLGLADEAFSRPQEGDRMRRTFLVALVTTVFAVTAGVAYAGNAHYIKSASGVSITQSTNTSTGGALTCSFKEAGLQSGSTETIT